MIEGTIVYSGDPWHWIAAFACLISWLALTLYCIRKKAGGEAAGGADILIIYASQTGHAQDIAEVTYQRVSANGERCELSSANRLTPDALDRAQSIYFILSTHGEGEPPDNARSFERKFLNGRRDLSHIEVAVLALGDRRYDKFCAFGRKVHSWADDCGAKMMAPPVEVNDLSPGDLGQWDRLLTGRGFASSGEEADAKITQWQVTSRSQVAEKSYNRSGTQNSDGLYRLTLAPVAGLAPLWEIGDLFELRTPDGHLRDYSIANRPGNDEILLFVRRMISDGAVGRGSGLLTGAEQGKTLLDGRVREHRSFRAPTGDGPILAIGAGSGWAGLRPHLLHAQELRQDCWLVFGDRGPDTALPLMEEMREWHASEKLAGLDIALSQPGFGRGFYVQSVLEQKHLQIIEFLGQSGRVLLCGRLAMGEACSAVLANFLGQEWVDSARADGRWRQDFY